MDQKVSEYLTRNRVCVLTVTLSDNSLHSSAMHYSPAADFSALYFSTDINSRKCLGLKDHQSTQAAVVIGFSETEWVTLQMSGTICIISDNERLTPEAVASIKAIHYSRHPASAKFKDNPDTVFLEFTPTCYRYTDFNSHPPLFIEK